MVQASSVPPSPATRKHRPGPRCHNPWSPTTSIWFRNQSLRRPMRTRSTRRRHTHLHQPWVVCQSTRVGSTKHQLNPKFPIGNMRNLMRNRNSPTSTTSPSTLQRTTTRSTPPSTASQSIFLQRSTASLNTVLQLLSTVLQLKSTVLQLLSTVLQLKSTVLQLQNTVLQLKSTVLHLQSTVLQLQSTAHLRRRRSTNLKRRRSTNLRRRRSTNLRRR